MSVLAGASAALAGLVPQSTAALCNSFAAGALLAMVVETMIPEAAADSAPFNGWIAVLGFLALLLLIGSARGTPVRCWVGHGAP